MKRLFLFLILTAFLPALSLADYFGDVDEVIAGNNFGYSARQMAMGGAGIMSVDGTALFYNPANLARIPRIEFNLGFSYQKYNNETSSRSISNLTTYDIKDDKTNTRLNSLILSIPYPTWRGSLVFGAGMARPINFDKVSQLYYEEPGLSATEEIFETGGLNNYAFGFGIDLSPRISFGTSLLLYKGKHELNLDSDHSAGGASNSINQLLSYDYLGIGFRSGLSFQLSRYIGLGLVAEFPVSLNVQQDETYVEDGTTTYNYAEYNIDKPYSFGMGIVGRFNYLTIMADADYTDWSQLSYSDNSIMEANYNHLFSKFYTDVLTIKIGTEYVLPSLGLSLRAGYNYDPLPVKDRLVNDMTTFDGQARHGFTFGAGLLIDQVLTLDFAFVRAAFDENNLFTYTDLFGNETGFIASDHESSYNRVFITAAYRF